VWSAREDVAVLRARAEVAASAADRARCLHDIELALTAAVGPVERADLLMCRAEVRSNQWETREVLDDAMAAMDLYEEAGQPAAVLDAASLGAAFASRLGVLSLAVELAIKCILGMGSLEDDRVLADVANRIGIFCYSFLDYDRAVEQFELALQAAECCGDERKALRELHNIVDALLLAVRQVRATGERSERYDLHGNDRLEKAARALLRLLKEGTPDVQRQLGVQRLKAELLAEIGRPAEALRVLRDNAGDAAAIVGAAARSALGIIEARCLRALGRPEEAVTVASKSCELAERCDDSHETMLILDELVAAERDAGYLEAALADALELKRRMWAIHRSQTAQLVEQAWARAASERERKALEAQTAAAIRSAEEDALTRIGNRRLLERVLADLAGSGGQLALLMADIDYFKQINDTFGHEVGDHVLRALGSILATDARTGQIVVRYGGEEFVFALPSVELVAAREFAERIRRKVSSYSWEQLEGRLGVTISIGVACGPAVNWPSVLAAADRALYLAKQRGRNRVEVAGRTRRTA
jgi:diguanylate cyclase (GGDEF)-like protein